MQQKALIINWTISWKHNRWAYCIHAKLHKVKQYNQKNFYEEKYFAISIITETTILYKLW